MESQSIVYYDSMGGNNKDALRGLSNYLLKEHKTKKGSDLDMSDWKLTIAKDIPQQTNGSDCRVFTCIFAEYCSRKAKFTFNQSHMPYFRRRMVYEIVKNKLLSPAVPQTDVSTIIRSQEPRSKSLARFDNADNDLLSTLKAGTKLKAQATGSKPKPRASGQEPKGKLSMFTIN